MTCPFQVHCHRPFSINLDRAAPVSPCPRQIPHCNSPVDPADERIRRQKPDGARQKSVHRTRQEAVAEEEQTRHKPSNVQVEKVVPDAVRKHPERAAAARQETLPPPVVVLSMSAEFNPRSIDRLTSAHNWLYVAITVTSLTVTIRIVVTALKNPNT